MPTKDGSHLALTTSHGCLHVQPNDRDRLIERGYLQKVVTIVVKRYSASLDFGAKNRD